MLSLYTTDCSTPHRENVITPMVTHRFSRTFASAHLREAFVLSTISSSRVSIVSRLRSTIQRLAIIKEIYITRYLRRGFQVLWERKSPSVKVTTIESFSLIDILVWTTVFRNSDNVRTIILVTMVTMVTMVGLQWWHWLDQFRNFRSIVRFKAIAIPKNLGAGLPSASDPSPRTFIA